MSKQPNGLLAVWLTDEERYVTDADFGMGGYGVVLTFSKLEAAMKFTEGKEGVHLLMLTPYWFEKQLEESVPYGEACLLGGDAGVLPTMPLTTPFGDLGGRPVGSV